MLPFFNVKAIDNSLAQERELRALIRRLSGNKGGIKMSIGKYALDIELLDSYYPIGLTDAFWELFLGMTVEHKLDAMMRWETEFYLDRVKMKDEFEYYQYWFKNEIFYRDEVAIQFVILTIYDHEAKVFNERFKAEYLIKCDFNASIF